MVVRSAEPPARLLPGTMALGDAVPSSGGPWRAGWQVWVVRDSSGPLPEDLLDRLRTATGGPVLLGRVLDSSAVRVTGVGAAPPPWEVWLQLDYAMGYLLAPPSPFDDDGNFLGSDWRDPEYEAEVELVRREILDEAPGGTAGARTVTDWARGAGLTPDSVEAVAGVLDGKETFAEDLFFDLLRRLGLSTG
ncbi:hypothetical protein GCM10027610_049280 [Dactylosporangium cerinum]